MTSLLDIAPASSKVQGVPICGVSMEGVASLMLRFPEIKAMLAGGGKVNITPDMVVMKAPEAVKAIIAAGTGSPGDESAEAAASRLPLEMQLDFMEAIIKATMPSGFGPFVKRLRALEGSLGKTPPSAPPAPAPVSTSRQPSTRSYKRGKSMKL